ADFDAAFDQAAREKADALYVLGDPLTYVHRAQIADLAVQRKLPNINVSRTSVEAGGLVSYGPRLRDVYRRASDYVARIFKGAKPSEPPGDQPPAVELGVDGENRKAVGLTPD